MDYCQLLQDTTPSLPMQPVPERANKKKGTPLGVCAIWMSLILPSPLREATVYAVITTLSPLKPRGSRNLVYEFLLMRVLNSPSSGLRSVGWALPSEAFRISRVKEPAHRIPTTSTMNITHRRGQICELDHISGRVDFQSRSGYV
jgi:hypothetical protein